MIKSDTGFYRPDEAIDPGIAATLSRGQQRQAEARMDPAERKRKRKQKVKNEAVKDRRVSWLIDPQVKTWVSEQAAQLQCSESQVVEFALRYLAGDVTIGYIFLSQYTQPQANPAYKNRLVFPEPHDPANP